ncbi:MAG: hypothetical protein Q7R64_03250, partial [bacterium]|nr:hypothetical protein [bacterium]
SSFFILHPSSFMLHSLSHHAYAIAGTAEDMLPELLCMLETSLKVRTKGNPDFLLQQYETMGIGEAHELKKSAERKSVSDDKKVFVVLARGITREAQNALLKVFEEPPADTHFFLVVPSFALLLPTLRSRLEVLDLHPDGEGADIKIATEFLAGTVPARLSFVQKMLKELEQEKKKQEDSSELLLEKTRILAFLDSLEYTLAKRDHVAVAPALREVLEVKKYSRDRAPSLKLLLEHLALVLPRL